VIAIAFQISIIANIECGGGPKRMDGRINWGIIDDDDKTFSPSAGRSVFVVGVN
jgi:hypothetical protein